MGIVEALILVVISVSSGYQAGKAGQRSEAVADGKICFDQEYNGRQKGCYEVKKPTHSKLSKK